MSQEKQPFERLTQALPYLGDADLLTLLKAVDELGHAIHSDPVLQGQRFEAQGTFYSQPFGPSLALEEMLQLAKTLNPAEMLVLRTLVPYYFDRNRYADGQQVSASWGTTSPHVRYSSNVMTSAPWKLSSEDMQQRNELFKSLVGFVQSVQKARAAGDNQLAAQLLEQVTSSLKDQGISGPYLEYLLSLFQG